MGKTWMSCENDEAESEIGTSGSVEKWKAGDGSLAEIDSVETRMGKKTIELHHVSKSYGERKLIDNFDYIVLKNQNTWNCRTKWLWQIDAVKNDRGTC